MKRLAASVCIALLMATSSSFSQQKPADNVSGTIQALSKQWFDAFLNGDGATMDKLEAPEFTLIDGPGLFEKKGPRAIRARKPDRTYTVDQIRVRTRGETAVLTAHHVWNLNSGATEERRVTEVWQQIDGQWRIWSAHASEVPTKK